MSRVKLCEDCRAPMVHTSDRYCLDCLNIRRVPIEVETVKRIVAWLRAEGARRWMAGDDDAERVYGGIADAIERGEWRK